MKKILPITIVAGLSFAFISSHAQNIFPSTGKVGIGTTSPNASSLLEVKSTNKGMLIPRMTRAQRNAIPSPATSLLVYVTDVNPGFYFYSGTTWVGLVAKNNGWLSTGNTLLDSATNFIGTIDKGPFSIRTYNVERMHVSSTGNIGIGTAKPAASSLLDIKSTTKGILIPRMTQSQRNTIASPVTGLLIYQTDNTPGFYFYNGTQWTAITFQGANKTLSNLTEPAAINVSLLPGTTNSKNLGSAGKQWKYLYLQRGIYIDGYLTMYSTVFRNFFAGFRAGNGDFNPVAVDNTGIGGFALTGLEDGNDNAALGTYALYNNARGSNNTAVGWASLYTNYGGNSNTAVGNEALYYNYSSNNTATGIEALYNNTSGYSNVAMGVKSLFSNSTGNNLVAVGDSALYHQTSGGYYQNTAVGSKALYSNTSGSFTTANGYQALYANTTGFSNTAMGYQSMLFTTTGSYNTGIGVYALYSNSSGNYNTGVGEEALFGVTTGGGNTGVGLFADVSDGTSFNGTAVGYEAFATASNQVMLGNSAVTSVKAAGSYVIYSDGRYKKDVKDNVPGLAFINKLRPVTYHYDVHGMNDQMGVTALQKRANSINKTESNTGMDKLMEDAISSKEKKLYTGFVAQEVEAAANKLNYDFSGVYKPQNDKDLYGLSYADFVVPLVKAVQELSLMNDVKDSVLKQQNIKIDNLQNQINELKAMIISNQSSASNQLTAIISSASLSQNIPNPFSNSTTINYALPQNYSSAKIIVTDKKGVVLKQINLSVKGSGSLNIDASTLASGAYQYSLYVNGRLIDTKQMLLNK